MSKVATQTHTFEEHKLGHFLGDIMNKTAVLNNGMKLVANNGPRSQRLADARVLAMLNAPAADPILYWNDVALEANRVSHTNGAGEQTAPLLSSRALAIVHLAMYDAYAGVMGNPSGLPAYLPGLPAAAVGASADVAVGAAAYATLSALFPSQLAYFAQKWAEANLMGVPGFNDGRDFGTEVAHRILADRKDDPGDKDTGYAPSAARGAHRPDPDNAPQPYLGAFYGERCKAFAITNRTALRLDAPPALGSAEYDAALKQVWGKGIAPELTGTLPAGMPGITPRTSEETLIGTFWGYDGSKEIGTPPRFYNHIVRQVAINQGNSVAQNARLFALVNVAMADAGILAWEEKYRHNLWRPVLAIRENDPSFGANGTPANPIDPLCDPFWLPLGAPKSNEIAKNFTPPFPAYPSGHATFGGAAFHITRRFYDVGGTLSGGDLGPDTLLAGIGVVSDELNGKNKDNRGAIRSRHVRSYSGGLYQAMIENGRSRVFLGVHWVFDAFALTGADAPDLTRNVGGVMLGMKIAEDIFASGMTKSAV